MRLLHASREILRVLALCPCVPVDALVPLIGARSRISVYQTLARLTAAGLVEKRHARPGLLASSRPTARWALHNGRP